MTGGVRDLHGVTAAQLGRLFGVPTRVARGWLSDLPVPVAHQARMNRLVAVWPTGNEFEIRAALFRSAGGPSLYHQLCAEIEGPQRLHWAAIDPQVQFGGRS